MLISFRFYAVRNDVSIFGIIKRNVRSSSWSVIEDKYLSSDGVYRPYSTYKFSFSSLDDVVSYFLGHGFTFKMF